jgi:hypothetical protein
VGGISEKERKKEKKVPKQTTNNRQKGRTLMSLPPQPPFFVPKTCPKQCKNNAKDAPKRKKIPNPSQWAPSLPQRLERERVRCNLQEDEKKKKPNQTQQTQQTPSISGFHSNQSLIYIAPHMHTFVV